MTQDEFNAAFEPLYGELRGYLLKRMGDEDDADDVVQLTVESAIKGLHTFREGTNLRAWIFQIARNESIDLWNRRKRERRKKERIANTPDAKPPEMSAEERVLVSETDWRLRAALDQIPSQMRRALELNVIHELEYKQIAAMEGVPEGTVMSRIHRAKTQLRERLSEIDLDTRLRKS